jgi:N-acetylmuramoyl-L-alanine amidase
MESRESKTKGENNMINIVISPSQQSWNKCAQGDSEQDHCYEICKKVVDLLRQYECNVCLVPKMLGSEGNTLGQVVTISNNFIRSFGGKGYHLDVHTDAGYKSSGSSGFYISEAGKGFITQIWREVSNVTPWGDGKILLRNLYVLQNTIAVAGLIELSFHDSPEESKWIHMSMDILAQAIVKGIVGATKIKKVDVPPEHWAEESYQKLLASGRIIHERDFDKPLRRGDYFVLEAQKLPK